MTTESKMFIGIGLATVALIAGGVVLVSNTGPSSKSLMGETVQVSGGHVAQGTPVQFITDPPAGGQHYDVTAHAGFYDATNVPADGNLVHSLEHGAVILWYNPKKLSTSQFNKLKDIFNQTSGAKGIMAPRSDMDIPIALTSWGRSLKLKKLDTQQITAFMQTNMYHGTEQAPI